MSEGKIQVYGKKRTGPRAGKLFFCLCPPPGPSVSDTLNGATPAYPGRYQVAPLMPSAQSFEL
jgi:hypothetical protein